MWFRKKRKMDGALVQARTARIESERQLEEARKHVIEPLKALHKELVRENHVTDTLAYLIQGRKESR
jgi:hypothetical protein